MRKLENAKGWHKISKNVTDCKDFKQLVKYIKETGLESFCVSKMSGNWDVNEVQWGVVVKVGEFRYLNDALYFKRALVKFTGLPYRGITS